VQWLLDRLRIGAPLLLPRSVGKSVAHGHITIAHRPVLRGFLLCSRAATILVVGLLRGSAVVGGLVAERLEPLVQGGLIAVTQEIQ